MISTDVLDREPNLDFQATAISIASASAAAINDCYSLGDRQAQTGSSSLVLATFRNSIERLKNTTEGFRRHAVAAVGNENSRGVGAVADKIQRERHLCLGFGVVNCVPHHVFNAAPQERWISFQPTIAGSRDDD